MSTVKPKTPPRKPAEKTHKKSLAGNQALSMTAEGGRVGKGDSEPAEGGRQVATGTSPMVVDGSWLTSYIRNTGFHRGALQEVMRVIPQLKIRELLDIHDGKARLVGDSRDGVFLEYKP